MPSFRQRIELDHPVEEVFAWHTRPGAFERLAPPWEEVRVRERVGGVGPGGRVVLGLQKGPAELRWELEHTSFEEDRLFVDEQRSGPFARWRHEHRFDPVGPGRTAVEDVVEWEPPLGGFGRAVSARTVDRMLDRLFAFRARRLANDLELHGRYGSAPMSVAVTGSSGLVGDALVHFLRSGGHRVHRVVRGADRDGGAIHWDPVTGRIDADRFSGIDAVVHLAGESVAGVRWTTAKKEEILRSREAGTGLLARTLADLDDPPRVLVSASGVDYYGSRGDEVLTEDASPGAGFLAEVARRWERATRPARAAGIRTVLLRSGAVLSPRGGMLGTILLPFRGGLGGRVGSGRQFMSWIDHDDEVGLIMHALATEELRGPMNATSPSPLPNASFTDVLGRVLKRPTVIPLPSPAVRALLGQMGVELLLTSRRVVPERASKTGYRFLFPDLEESLRHQLGRPE